MGWLASVNVHAGSPLPAARAVVLGVPLMALFVWWFVTRRRKQP